MIQKKDLAIYVHIPFCIRKCYYCDFASFVAPRQTQALYMQSLQEELKSYTPLGNHYIVRSIYFGGGTPSVLEPIYLMRVLLDIRDHFLVAKDVEITVECNPGTLSESKLQEYKALGINRLSIGLQSANDAELKLLGRIHTWSVFRSNYALARRLGFDNINIDLMQSLPHQTVEGWMDTLQKVTELSPEHISAYSLTIEPGTPFYNTYGSPEGQKELPSEEEDREMYHRTRDFLHARGYERYEISNYAKEGYESRHNITYWVGGDYLGLGLNAASYMDGRRFTNPKDLQEYRDTARGAYARCKAAEPLTEKARMEEFMFLGLRMMQGVSEMEFRNRFRKTIADVYGDIPTKLMAEGLLKREKGRLKLTERGIDVSNGVMAEFIL
ncbi:MAG: oxygen-independent coproporphyrinogen III oxidase [Lachnospiraceae bacterium]|nr:oxygen-independent coproporphyrinogen III oxidase [Lachnospiraceae bacterium]